jgi:hypothetical protein
VLLMAANRTPMAIIRSWGPWRGDDVGRGAIAVAQRAIFLAM